MNHPSGLSEGTLRVYRLRVSHPTDSTAGLARRAGLAREAVVRAEGELSALGLLRPSPAGGWVAVAPESAAEDLLTTEEQEILRRQIAVAATRTRLHSLSGHFLEARSLRSAPGDIETIEGLENIRAVLSDLARECRHSLDSMQSGRRVSEEAIRASIPLDLAHLERGVAIRTLLPRSARGDRAAVQYATLIRDAGAHVRCAGVLPSRMLIYDGTRAVLPLDVEDTARGAVVIRDPAVMAFLRRLFDHFWERSEGFPDPDADPGEAAPSGSARDVLLLLASGHTNEEIAERLGTSPRTVVRTVTELMERLGADSRFQAGVLAAERGWLDDPGPEDDG
ncbi:LuxR C-terminal-related transcriptional regulator [Streptomyces sp. ST2-7A]|uniref:helix-turn-helix transcriptional regulator n=1 Tax=Streptomyces sp. ST2-7A TaxID=2907214 RepID=UPI001F2A97D6|nr:LuxR C-terminal-related transcriptional regulator [Streptomyces sp. ST2-7A]MCE7082412.1 LuxR C-terminal-related transcriptional regulator [Streptomyces sp. ST2-7A]